MSGKGPRGRGARAPLLLALASIGAICAQGCDGGPHYPIRDGGAGVRETGSVMVSGGFDLCPAVLFEATPAMTAVGGTIALRAQGTGGDGRDAGAPSDGGSRADAGSAAAAGAGAPDARAPDGGGALTFMWTADSGTLGSASAPSTTFTCTQAGPVTIKLSVSDGSCVTALDAAVFCLALVDGGPTGAGGGTGSSGGGGAGGGGGPPVVNTCPSAEPTSGGADCPTCTMAQCSLGPTGTDGCCGLTSVADQVLCEAVVACSSAKTAKCIDANMDPTNCFCGTSGASCFMIPGAANGPCVAAVVAAAKTATPAAIQGQFTSPASPLGRAVNVVACRASFCGAECALTSQ